MHDAVQQLVVWVVNVIDRFGYPGIFIGMALESTFVPLPSEVIIPPAGYLASLPVSDPRHMSLFMVVLMGTVGSMVGASFNYGLALLLGRPFLLKYGKYFLCPPHKFEKVEKFFLVHGEMGTFTGRLILGVRHFISFPAGLARMKMSHFLFFTGVGSGVWCTVLALIGWYIGKVSATLSPEETQHLFETYGKQAAYVCAAACVVLLAAYVYVHKRKTARTCPSTTEKGTPGK